MPSTTDRPRWATTATRSTSGPNPGADLQRLLYFHGRNDGCLGVDLIDEGALKDALGPGGEYVFVDGAGHFMHLEKPDEINARIIEFLKS
jgi:pimeloyl-ACP methyl ester carboxylesterase